MRENPANTQAKSRAMCFATQNCAVNHAVTSTVWPCTCGQLAGSIEQAASNWGEVPKNW